MKKIILTIILILWMMLIFIFSSMNADNSNGRSESIIKNVVTVTNNVLNLKLSDKKIDNIVTNLNYPVRKCAHVLEYLILGILLMHTIYNNSNKMLYIIISIIFLYACTDEFHQMFTGRTSKFQDVVIDTLGGILGVLFYLKFKLKNQ